MLVILFLSLNFLSFKGIFDIAAPPEIPINARYQNFNDHSHNNQISPMRHFSDIKAIHRRLWHSIRDYSSSLLFTNPLH